MKQALNFGVNSPLTLNMGHPIHERLASLQHVKKRGQILPAAIGLSILMVSTISSVSAETGDAEAKTATSIAVTETVTLPNMAATIPAAEVNEARVQPISITETRPAFSAKAMRLRMTPRFTSEQLDTIQALRLSMADKEPGSKAALSGAVMNLNYYNRYQVNMDSSGDGVLLLSDGTGGWPGYTIGSKHWGKRPLSTNMKRGLKTIIEACGNQNAPTYFLSTTVDGDADVGRGDYLVECMPGSESERAKTSRVDLAEAWLASDGVPLKERQENVDWRMSFAMMDEYVESDVEHSIAADRDACFRILSTIRDKFEFDESGYSGASKLLEKCPTGDYNWVRRRLDIPEI